MILFQENANPAEHHQKHLVFYFNGLASFVTFNFETFQQFEELFLRFPVQLIDEFVAIQEESYQDFFMLRLKGFIGLEII